MTVILTLLMLKQEDHRELEASRNERYWLQRKTKMGRHGGAGLYSLPALGKLRKE